MKLPQDISGPGAIKALSRLGFMTTRQDESHVRMSREDLHVTMPNHKTILPKTLQSILRQAGLSVEEFIRCL